LVAQSMHSALRSHVRLLATGARRQGKGVASSDGSASKPRAGKRRTLYPNLVPRPVKRAPVRETAEAQEDWINSEARSANISYNEKWLMISENA
ncbi:MAG: hypothetical protein SGPRY_012823, partial [Prymnesium sp.]